MASSSVVVHRHCSSRDCPLLCLLQDLLVQAPLGRSSGSPWPQSISRTAVLSCTPMLRSLTDCACLVFSTTMSSIAHCKKRIKVKGKWVWKPPTYVKLITHKDPKSGLPIKTKGGTQIIDRAWRYLKDRIKLNQNCTVGSPLMRIKIRSAQYEYWHRNADLWLACGTLCSWHMAKI